MQRKIPVKRNTARFSGLFYELDKTRLRLLRIFQRIVEKVFPQVTRPQARQKSRSPKSLWWSYYPVVLVAVIGLTITLGVFNQSLHWEKSRVDIAFREASQDRILVIHRELRYSFGIVQDIASFFEASEFVGRREFRKFVGPTLKNQIGIKALEWIPVVRADDLPEFLKDARRSFPPFKIIEADPLGNPIESRNRSTYYPVLYVQPYQSNKQSLGLDMGTNPVVSSLLQEAQLNRSMQLSTGLTFTTEDGERTGIVVVVPVFHKQDEEGDLSHQLPPAIRGFALGVFYVGHIIEHALGGLQPGGIDLHFFHQHTDGDQQLLYTHLSRNRTDQAKTEESHVLEMSYRQDLTIGNQTWKVLSHPITDKYQTERWNSWIILLGGLAFTLLLAIYASSLVERARRVRLEVDIRTSQLREAVHALNREVVERKSAEQKLQRLNESL
ncbi:MAG: CHASE domain-containing protein, partial [Gammaproteobacteria bacterium]|nr:CHASE domain-containing protein [Gammaproteobacteria bacterium]